MTPTTHSRSSLNDSALSSRRPSLVGPIVRFSRGFSEGVSLSAIEVFEKIKDIAAPSLEKIKLKALPLLKKKLIVRWSSNLAKEEGISPCKLQLQGGIRVFLQTWINKNRESAAAILSMPVEDFIEIQVDLEKVVSFLVADVVVRLAEKGSTRPISDALVFIVDEVLKSYEKVLSKKYEGEDPVWRTGALGKRIMDKAFSKDKGPLKVPYNLDWLGSKLLKAFLVPSDGKVLNVAGMVKPESFFSVLCKVGIIDHPDLEMKVAAKKGGRLALFMLSQIACMSAYALPRLPNPLLIHFFARFFSKEESLFWIDGIKVFLNNSKEIPWLAQKLTYNLLLQELSKCEGGDTSIFTEFVTSDATLARIEILLLKNDAEESPKKKLIQDELKALLSSIDWQSDTLLTALKEEMREFYPEDADQLVEEIRETLREIGENKACTELITQIAARRGSYLLLNLRNMKKNSIPSMPKAFRKSAFRLGKMILKPLKTEQLEGIARIFMDCGGEWQEKIEARWKQIDNILFDPSSLIDKNILELRLERGEEWNERLFRLSGEKKARDAFQRVVLHAGKRLQQSLPEPYQLSFVPQIFEGIFLKVFVNLLAKKEDPQVPIPQDKEHPKKLMPLHLFSNLLDEWRQHYLIHKKKNPQSPPFQSLVENGIDYFGKDFLHELPVPKEIILPSEKFLKEEFLPGLLTNFHKKWREWQSNLPDNPDDYLAEFFKPGRMHSATEAISRAAGDYLHHLGKHSSGRIADAILRALRKEFETDPANKALLQWMDEEKASLEKIIRCNLEEFCSLENFKVNAFWEEIEKQVGAGFFLFMKNAAETAANIQNTEPHLLEVLTKETMGLFHEHVTGFVKSKDLYGSFSKEVGLEGLSKDELKTAFHLQVSKRLFRLINVVDAPESPLPIWKTLQETLVPNTIGKILSNLLKNRDAFAYQALESLDKSAQGDSDPAIEAKKDSLDPFPEFDDAVSECLTELSQILPNLFKKFLFHRLESSKQKEVSAKIRSSLKKQNLLNLLDKGLEKGLQSVHRGKWNVQRINGKEVEAFHAEGGRYHFRFGEGLSSFKSPIDKTQLRERIITKIEDGITTAISRAITNRWKSFQDRIDATTLHYFGVKGLQGKQFLDPWFRYIFISCLGKLIALILWPIKQAFLWTLRMGLRAKVYQIHRAMDHEAHEIFLYRVLNRVLLTFEQIKDEHYQKIQDRGPRVPDQSV